MPPSSPPPRRRPKDLAGYLETLSRTVFQAGISWRVIEAKWDGIHDALEGFDPKKVAAFGPKKVDRLMANESIVRSRPKIEAVIDNAQTLLELDAKHGGFARYLTVHGHTAAVAKDLQRQFRFIGPSGALHVPVHGRRARPLSRPMAGRQAKAINARSQVTDVTADPSMGGDPLPAPITFLAT